MFDRLGQPALLGEHNAPVVVGKGIVRLDTQGLPVVFDRLGRLALLSERDAQVVVGLGVFRPDLQGSLVMFDRLGPLLLISAHKTQIVLGDRRLGVYGKDMGPKSLRVVPDLDLVPGENAQPDDDT